jgi:hypothetical protein
MGTKLYTVAAMNAKQGQIFFFIPKNRLYRATTKAGFTAVTQLFQELYSALFTLF